jgi:fructose-1,6-bisphosphatase/sedoheptulose 1,7-bisphosphatase-like protein
MTLPACRFKKSPFGGFQMIISSPQEALHIMAHSSHGSLAAAAKAFAQTLRPGPEFVGSCREGHPGGEMR